MKLKVSLFVSLMSLSSSLFAANNWTSPIDISAVRALDNGNIMVQSTTVIDPNCPGAGKQFYAMLNQNNVTSEGLKSLLSISLVSFSTNTKLNILYDNASANCYISNVEIAK